MASTFERCTEMIMRQVFEESRGELSSHNPMVFSCGGIYIPHPEAQSRALQEIIVTGNHKEPVKVIAGAVRRNTLTSLLAKGAMN